MSSVLQLLEELNFLAVCREGLMTHSKCRVDRLFPYHVIWCWVRTEPPPPQYRQWIAYLNGLFGAEPSVHQNAVTWTCDWLNWFSPIIIVIAFISPICIVTQS